MSSTCPSSGVTGPCLTYLSAGQAVGLMFDFESGAISCLAVLILTALVIRNGIRDKQRPPPERQSLLRSHIDLYILSLLLFEIIHGAAAIINIRWVYAGEVSCGIYCTVQGATRNVGSTGVALVTLVIAIHTFAVIFFQWIPPKSFLIPVTVLSGIWSCIAVYVCFQLLEPRSPDSPFYAPTPYWCWIGPHHTAERVWGQYLWMWLAAFMSILLYVPLYFCVRGNLTYRPRSRWKIRITRTPKLVFGDAQMQTHAAKVATKDAMCLLYYPVVYVLLVLPLSIVRFMSESWQEEGRVFPFAPTATGSAIFGLSGIVNVILYVRTRPNLLLFRPRSPSHSRVKTPSEDPLFWQRQIDYPLYPPPTGTLASPLLPGSRTLQNTWDLEISRERLHW